jgi:hypothetical protein
MRKYITHPLGIFIILIHVVYFFIALKIGSIYLVDSYGYLNQAKNILAHHSWYAEDWNAPILIDYFTIRPPLYAFFILACKCFIDSDYFVIFAQGLMSIFNFFLLWKLLKQSNIPQKNITLSIVAALVLFPSQLIHANFIMTEILFQTLLMGVFYFSVKTIQIPNLVNIFKIAILLSLAMLTKPVIFLFGIVLFAFFMVIFWKKNKLILLPFLLLPITYHLFCLQNKHTTGFYHYSSIKIMADLRVNARYILASKYGEDSSAAFCSKVFEEAKEMKNYEARYHHIEARCNEVYTQNKMVFALLYAKGIVATFIDPGRFDLSLFFGLQINSTQGLFHRLNTEGVKAIPDILKQSPVFLLSTLCIILLWTSLLTLSVLVFVFDKKIDLLLRILVFLFIAYIPLVTGISGLCRYRIPIYLEFIFVFAFALPHFINIVKRKNINA